MHESLLHAAAFNGRNRQKQCPCLPIHFITPFSDIQNPELSIDSHSEQFTNDGVVVLLEWTYMYLTSVTYYQQLLPNISINVVPATRLDAVLIGNTSVQIISLQYNTQYNVSITQPGICGQPNQSAFIELSYGTL